MKKKNKWLTVAIGFMVLTLTSCKTYTIPLESFREQMKNTNAATTKAVTVGNPLAFGNIAYNANNIDRIIAVDTDGNKIVLNNSGAIEIRVTHKNGKKYLMYFDTVLLENDTLKGGRSRFVQSVKR